MSVGRSVYLGGVDRGGACVYYLICQATPPSVCFDDPGAWCVAVNYMPNRAPRPCRWNGCAELTTATHGFCVQHRRDDRRRWDEGRESAAVRGYGARWRRLRVMFLRSHPLCVDPFGVHEGRPTPATDVDHILPKRQGGTDSWENLQPLCHSCHSRKSAEETFRP